MKIPKYWAKGSAEGGPTMRNPATGEPMGDFACWGWSDISLEEATKKGAQRAAEVMGRIQQGKRPGQYHYGNRPVREEILQEWRRSDGSVFAATTRNVYGCQVLNTANAMFVDVDIEEDISGWEYFIYNLKRLFNRKEALPEEKQVAEALVKLHTLIDSDPNYGARVYRTRGGLRYLLTHTQADPTSSASQTLLESLGADPLYIRLCKLQESYRARLTPKPWRCDFHDLKIRYPWQSPKAEKEAQQWLAIYEKKAEAYDTCRFLGHLGSTQMNEEISTVVEIHDEATKAQTGKWLA